MTSGRPKGGKDNPTNQQKFPNQTVAQQKSSKEKNSKAKKVTNIKTKQQQGLEVKDCRAD